MPLVFFMFLFFSASSQAHNQQERLPLALENPQTAIHVALRPERVIDGDTFVASGVKIRLWGVDAPEKNETLYAVSSKALKHFLNGASLACKFITRDRYERDVMHCLVNGADLGALMVKSGFAKDYRKYSQGFYQSEEDFALEAGLGIWKAP